MRRAYVISNGSCINDNSNLSLSGREKTKKKRKGLVPVAVADVELLSVLLPLHKEEE